MPGTVIDATPIAVDFWRPTKAPQVRLFFLTHLHSDHIDGLTSTWRLPLFTSPINARLLKEKFKLPDSVVHVLDVGESHLIPLVEGSSSTITVTVLDANHVPGAVMFLFQGYFGNILYCGDMRWRPEMLEDPVLQAVVQHRALDVLYLDNTYSAPYCQFPSREEATEQICQIIHTYPDHEIKIGVYNLGREKLLEDIAQRFGERILVTQEMYNQLQLLGRLDVFTTDPKLSRIHAVSMRQMVVASHQKWNEITQTISIIPSALFVGWQNGPFSSQASNGMHLVPYSDHSSYSELMDMVSQLAPHQIYPVVNYFPKSGWWADSSAPDQNVKADMTVYRHLLSLPPPDPVEIPEDVIKIMDSKAPRLIQIRPQLCVLRKGLSPRRPIKPARGVVFSPSASPSCTPISFTSPRSSRCDSRSPRKASFKMSPRTVKHRVKHTSPSVTSSTRQSPGTKESEIKFIDSRSSARMVTEEGQPKNCVSCPGAPVTKRKNTDCEQQTISEMGKNLKKKTKSQDIISMRRDSLLKETIEFITLKTEEMDRTSDTEVELSAIVKDAKLILESISYLDALL